MIDRIGAGDQSSLGASLHLREQSPVIPKKYYESHTAHSNRKRSQQPEANYMIGGRYNSCQKNTFTIDKEFLTKLEVSLKKLTKSNERIKQIMREKEEFEK